MRDAIAEIGRVTLFAWHVFTSTLRGRVSFAATYGYFGAVFLRCVLPVMATVFPSGMVMALQGLEIFALFGTERLLASLISVAVLRELSPVLACVLVAAQGGSSFAAELGAMRIKEELDATEVMAVDSIACHAAPRVLALLFACPLLNVLGSVAGLSGGFVTAVFFKGEQAGIFISELWSFTQPFDVWAGYIKCTIFGAIIGTISCYLGYYTKGGAAGVGKAVNDTVVYSVLVFIAANYALSSAMFGQV